MLSNEEQASPGMSRFWPVVPVIGLLSMVGYGIHKDQVAERALTPQQRQDRADRAQAQIDIENGVPRQVAIAADGTILYAVQHGHDLVYFSRAGTKWETQERSGKQTRTVEHDVPAREK